MIRLYNGTKHFLITSIIALFISITNNSFCITTSLSNPSDDAPEYDSDIINLISKDSNLSRLDLFVKTNYDELQFLKTDIDDFRAVYEISVIFYDKFDKQVDRKVWQEEVLTNNIDEINSTRLSKLSKVTFNLPPGEYKVIIELKDLETLKMGQQEQSIILRNYATQTMVTSDIIYLDYLYENEDGNYELNPKVSGLRYEDSNLYAYFEVYNIPDLDSVQIEYEIVNAENKVILAEKYWLRSRGAITKSVLEIPVDNLQHGRYSTQVHLTNNGLKVNLERPFNWYWEELPKSLTSLDEAIEVLKYLISTKDLNKLKIADKNKQYKEYVKFWKSLDPTPETYDNELRDEYYQRIQYANDNFFGLNKEGWKTDMGWVYIKIGLPDAIDRTPYEQRITGISQRSVKASEIWDYYKYNRKLLFLDENGFGEYRLENLQTFYEIVK